PRSCGERVGVRGLSADTDDHSEYGTPSPGSHLRCDIAEATLRRSLKGRPPEASYASPRRRTAGGERLRAEPLASDLQSKGNERTWILICPRSSGFSRKASAGCWAHSTTSTRARNTRRRKAAGAKLSGANWRNKACSACRSPKMTAVLAPARSRP